MIRLTPVTFENSRDFADTAYAEMSDEARLRMIGESLRKEHGGKYFELLAVCEGDEIVGFMNLYALSGRVISVGPEIKGAFRRRGYGYLGEAQALRYARDAGYVLAAANVREDNRASIALHEKLGFEVVAHCLSKKGNPIRVYVRAL